MQQLGDMRAVRALPSRDFELARANSIIDRARRVETNFQDLTKTVAQKLGARKEDIKFGPIKGSGDMLTKAERKFNGDVAEVKDVLRATITMHRPEDQVEKALTFLKLMEQGKLRCIRGITPYNIKNTFEDSSYNGFKMLKANFVIAGFDATEIQLCLPSNEKEVEKSHDAYAIQRACDHAFETGFSSHSGIQSGRMSPEEQAELSRALDKMRRRAGAARELHNDRAFS